MNPLITYGTVQQFTTLASTMNVMPIVDGTNVTLSGEVTSGSPGVVKALISLNPISFSTEKNATVQSNGTFSATFSGLSDSTLYYFKIVNAASPGIVYVSGSFQTGSANIIVSYQGLTHESVQFYGERAPGGPDILIGWDKNENNLANPPIDHIFEPIFVNDHFSYVLPGLEANTTYYYQVVDKNDPTKKYGPSETVPPTFASFRTLNAPIVGSGDGGTVTEGTPYDPSMKESLIPCGRRGQPACNFKYFIELLNRFIRFVLFTLAMPVAALLFAYAGFLFMTSGSNPTKRSDAKKIFIDVFWGFIIALAAFLIVKSIMSGLGYTGTTYLK